MTQTDGLLFDPNTYDPQQFDAETRRLLRATIDFFEGQGKKRLLDDDLGASGPPSSSTSSSARSCSRRS